MHKKRSSPASGIQIENTLSMALQNRTGTMRLPLLLLIAAAGVTGFLGTFLSMFGLSYHPAALFGGAVPIFALMAFMASTPKKYRPFRWCVWGGILLTAVLCFGLLSDGFVWILNQIYKASRLTDQDLYVVTVLRSEKLCTTVFLLFAVVLISFCVCYGVIRFQSFLVGFLSTFLPVEVGFFFGIAANHYFAILLFSFWCAIGALRLASFGIDQGSTKSSFLRRKNTFFPVTGMRFMLTERAAALTLVLTLGLGLVSELLLQASGYTRTQVMKDLRSQVQDLSASMMLDDANPLKPFVEGFFDSPKSAEEKDVVDLNEQDERQFENIPISAAQFNRLPEGRVYLKYYTGHVYDGNTWRQLEESAYEDPVFSAFENLGLYPQEFLYRSLEDTAEFRTVEMKLENTSGVLAASVPYGFREAGQLVCRYDDRMVTFSDTYRIYGGEDYESFLAKPENADFVSIYRYYNDSGNWGYQLPTFTGGDRLWFFGTGNNIREEKAVQASALCALGYTDFAEANYLALPQTSAMYRVYDEYAYLLQGYDHSSASPSQTIAFLQELRDAVCGSVSYSLNPGKTPSYEDFASYFLLDNQQGYCVHYATAATVLARMAGIPARYCEGYMIDCNNPRGGISKNETASGSSYTVPILDSNAHAWMEIYIEGLGWIPFEFTFSYFTPPASTPEPTVPNAPTEPAPTEPPTTIVPHVTSPVEETQTSETADLPSGSEQGDTISFDPMPLLVTLLVLAGLTGLLLLPVMLRRQRLMKRRRVFTQDDPQKAAEAIFAHILRLMKYCGVISHGGSVEQLTRLAEEGCGKYMKQCSLSEAIAIAAKARYSAHAPSEEELRYLRCTAAELGSGILEQSTFFETMKLKFILRLV